MHWVFASSLGSRHITLMSAAELLEHVKALPPEERASLVDAIN